MFSIKKTTTLTISLLMLLLAFIGYLCDSSKSLILPNVAAQTIDDVTAMPNFKAIKDISNKKQQFFDFLYPIILQENAHVLELRKSILTLKEVSIEQLKPHEVNWLLDVADYYKIETEGVNDALYARLLKRIDYIPPALALTQGAIESGWGTSRFATKGKNLFGQWCFSKGCGLVPTERSNGANHEVASFDTFNASVRAYIHNLNTNKAYEPMRRLRNEKRAEGLEITGQDAAQTLSQYSEEGHTYIKKIAKFMRQNRLSRYKQIEI